MGRGDNRTKRGKISSGTFGVARPSKVKKSNEVVAATAEEKKPAKKAVKKEKE